MIILKTRSKVKVIETRKWYSTLCHLKVHPHTKFGIPTSKNIGDMHRTQSGTDGPTDWRTGHKKIFRQKNKTNLENYNPTPLNMYNGLFQIYCKNPLVYTKIILMCILRHFIWVFTVRKVKVKGFPTLKAPRKNASKNVVC